MGSSVKHAKIWPRLKRITRKLALRRLRVKEKKRVMATSSEQPPIATNSLESIAVLTEPSSFDSTFTLPGQCVKQLHVGCFSSFARLMYHYGATVGNIPTCVIPLLLNSR